MPKLAFLSRVAFLCNVCFLLALFANYIPFIKNGVITSTIIIMGKVLAIIVNMLVVLLYVALMVARKSIFSFVPKWIIIVNFLFFILQVILLIK